MKKLLLVFLLFTLSIPSWAQLSTDSTVIRNRLIQTSELQEDAGDLILATGAGILLVTGVLLYHDDINGWATLQGVVAGAGLVGTGIMLLKISRQNAAKAAQIGLSRQTVLRPYRAALRFQQQPVLTLRVTL